MYSCKIDPLLPGQVLILNGLHCCHQFYNFLKICFIKKIVNKSFLDFILSQVSRFLMIHQLTHVIEPDSNLVVEIIKNWNDDGQQNLWYITEELNVLKILDLDINPLLQQIINSNILW